MSSSGPLLSASQALAIRTRTVMRMPRGAWPSSFKQFGHAGLAEDVVDGLGEKPGRGDDSDLVRDRLEAVLERVGDDELLDRAGVDALCRTGREHAVGDSGVHPFRPLLFQPGG